MIYNGKVVSNGNSGQQDGLSGITIEGAVGAHVVLQTKQAIELSGDAGANLSARAGGSFHADQGGSAPWEC